MTLDPFVVTDTPDGGWCVIDPRTAERMSNVTLDMGAAAIACRTLNDTRAAQVAALEALLKETP